MVEFTFLPVSSLKGKKEFRCPRKDQEDLVYNDIETLKNDYTNDVVRVSSTALLLRLKTLS